MSRVFRMIFCLPSFVGILLTSAPSDAAPPAPPTPRSSRGAAPKVARLLRKGYRLTRQHSRAAHLKGARLLLKAWKASPKRFKTLLGATRACHFLAKHSKQKKQIVHWALRGYRLAKQLTRRFPKRAEGYFWSAVNAGHHARGGGLWAAITGGLAGKIERNARRSLKLNPKLYGGNAQKILGRFYYRLPWPMRRLKKSERFLLQTFKLSPRDPTILFYLGETFWARNKKKRARRFMRKCAALLRPSMHKKASPRRCRRWLKKHP